MYHFVSLLARPYTLLVVALAIAAAWQWRRPSAEKRLRLIVTLLAACLFVVSCPLFGTFALWTLERHHPPAQKGPGPGDVVVVLSGGLVADPGGYRLGTDTLVRCLAGLALYREAGGCQLIVSGGKSRGMNAGPSVAAAMRDFLIQHGVQASDIALEDQSQTTYENAALTGQLLRTVSSGDVFLVTDAAHMHRAVACFKRQDIAVIPAACHYRAVRFDRNVGAFLPSASAANMTEAALHEWLGFVWYALRGYI